MPKYSLNLDGGYEAAQRSGIFIDLPESFVREKMIEPAAVCNMFLSGQKYPAGGMNQNGCRNEKIDTNFLEVGSAFQKTRDTVLRDLES